MFTLLYHVLDVLGDLPKSDMGGALSDFSDTNIISDYAKNPIEVLIGGGIIAGSDGKIDPLGSATRAQMAQVLYNLLNVIQ